MPGESLAALGLSAAEEATYRALLRGEGTVSVIARAVRTGPAQVRRSLVRLEQLGLATRLDDGGWTAVAPEAGLEALLAQRAEELNAARLAAALLEREYRHSHDAATDVAIPLVGRTAIAAQVQRIDRLVRDELLVLVKPPLVTGTLESGGFDGALDRGVTTRAIYDRAILEAPRAIEYLQAVSERGERARVASEVPLKLIVADRSTALLPLYLGEPESDRALLVRSSALLDALVRLFELLWADADEAPWETPLGPAPEGPRFDGQLVALLSAGFKDETIARQLGLGLRTVRRRISDLMDTLDARTRFQAGARAAQRGWTGADRPVDRPGSDTA